MIYFYKLVEKSIISFDSHGRHIVGLFAHSHKSFGVISNDPLRRTSKLLMVDTDNLTEMTSVDINDYISGFAFDGESLVLYSAAGHVTFWHFEMPVDK